MILLTGASGFIGSHLLNKLLASYSNEDIVALTSKPIKKINFILHNNYEFDNEMLNKNGKIIDTIILAGAFTPKSNDESNSIIDSLSNIINTSKLISCKLPKLKKIIFLSTIDVYSSDEIISENTLINPLSLYGYSKYYCEKMIEAFGRQNNVIINILRIGHVYGPGEEKYKKVIPVMLQNAIKGNDFIQYGDGKGIRSFINITDVVEAIIKCIELDEYVGPINIVSEEKIEIKQLMNKIILLSNKKIKIKVKKTNDIIRNLIFDNSKMRKYLITPRVKLDDGLQIEYDYFAKL